MCARHAARGGRVRRFAAVTLAAFLLPAVSIYADNHYPRIEHLDSSDIIFRQMQSDIGEYYIAAQAAKRPPVLEFFSYTVPKGQDLFGLAAQVSLPYDCIATLNRIDAPGPIPVGTQLVLPNIPGIFVPIHPRSELEYLMASWRQPDDPGAMQVSVYTASGLQSYLFFPGVRFHPVERGYFLGVLFRFPLPHGVITSPFGMRIDPFTHTEMFHSGVDIGAPEGTEVYAARGGVVEQIGNDREYGNFILIRHEGGYETLYGHLSAVLVRLNDRVTSGMIIAKVGSTGMSTGPHLHFEIRRNGRPEDPLPLLPKGDQ
jgi:murein DD-endopeptidase MepM/ murein hydrolase activator NlpD